MIDKKLLKYINFLNGLDRKLTMVNDQYSECKGKFLNDGISQLQLGILYKKLKNIDEYLKNCDISVNFFYRDKEYNKEILTNMVNEAHDKITSLHNKLF